MLNHLRPLLTVLQIGKKFLNETAIGSYLNLVETGKISFWVKRDTLIYTVSLVCETGKEKNRKVSSIDVVIIKNSG